VRCWVVISKSVRFCSISRSSFLVFFWEFSSSKRKEMISTLRSEILESKVRLVLSSSILDSFNRRLSTLLLA